MNHKIFTVQKRVSDGLSGIDHPFTQRPLPGHRFLKAFDRLNQRKNGSESTELEKMVIQTIPE